MCFVLGILKHNCGKAHRLCQKLQEFVAHTENGEESSSVPPAFLVTMSIKCAPFEMIMGLYSWLS